MGECLARGHHFKEGARNAQRRTHLNDLALEKKVKLKKSALSGMGMRTQASAGKPRFQPLGRGQKQEPGLCLPGPPEAPQVVPGFPRTALLLLGWD